MNMEWRHAGVGSCMFLGNCLVMLSQQLYSKRWAMLETEHWFLEKKKKPNGEEHLDRFMSSTFILPQ